MTHRIPDQLLAQCSDFITARFGLHFPKKRWRDLERGIVCAAGELGFTDTADCIRWLISAELTRNQLDTLAGCLTIGETYFFRERNSFDALETDILPALLSSRRGKDQRLRIWSAGCSTGEEPYSIAIMLHRMIADLPKWNITILATDINPDSLRKAARGEYGDWSFRGVPDGIKAKYFTSTREGKFAISDVIKNMVTFAPLNLAEDPYPSLVNNTNALDLILCRNVLMYFSSRQMKKVVGKFYHSLVTGGWLVVSPCETSHTLFSEYAAVPFYNMLFYRRGRENAAPVPLEATGGKSESPSSFIVADHEAASRFTLQLPLPPAQPLPAAVAERVLVEPRVYAYDEAQKLYRQGLFAEAMFKLTEFLAGETGESASPALYGKAATLLARIYANQGNLAAAMEWAEKAIAAEKLDPEAHYLQALIFQEQGADDGAIVSLKKALYLDQAFVLAHYALANLTLRHGKTKDAARHLDNAASLLQSYGGDDILPGSEGMSARRLAEIVAAIRGGIGRGRD